MEVISKIKNKGMLLSTCNFSACEAQAGEYLSLRPAWATKRRWRGGGRKWSKAE